MTIYEERLQSDLESLRQQFKALADVVGEALANAHKAALDADEELAYRTVLQDAKINRLSREIDEFCHRFIALHLPSAGHLRRISAAMRVNIQLERLGDYAVIVSRQAARLKKAPPPDVLRDLENVGEEARRMLQQSIEAFLTDKVETARVTVDMHGHMEHALNGVYEQLLGSQYAPEGLVAMFVIFNQLKRVADQSKNIAELAIFAATGETKGLKIPSVLFVDGDNAGLSKMAELVANKMFAGAGKFASAGRVAGTVLDARLAEFLEGRGIDVEAQKNVSLDSFKHELDSFDVIISVDGPVRSFISDVPFHTSALEWKIGEVNDFEGMYRAVTHNLTDLMVVLRGE